jgi:hypothetical protein
VFVRPKGVYRDNVRVLEAASDSGLVDKPQHVARRIALGQDLHGDLSLQGGVFRFKYRAHSPAADELADFVAAVVEADVLRKDFHDDTLSWGE